MPSSLISQGDSSVCARGGWFENVPIPAFSLLQLLLRLTEREKHGFSVKHSLLDPNRNRCSKQSLELMVVGQCAARTYLAVRAAVTGAAVTTPAAFGTVASHVSCK